MAAPKFSPFDSSGFMTNVLSSTSHLVRSQVHFFGHQLLITDFVVSAQFIFNLRTCPRVQV